MVGFSQLETTFSTKFDQLSEEVHQMRTSRTLVGSRAGSSLTDPSQAQVVAPGSVDTLLPSNNATVATSASPSMPTTVASSAATTNTGSGSRSLGSS